MASGASPFCLLKLPFSATTHTHFQGARLFPSPLVFTVKTNLSFSKAISTSIPLHRHSFICSPKPSSFTIFAHKGYKMKTHKASAKRFRVTGKGKIVRRRAGKQHLLAKKNTKRKLRLSKMETQALTEEALQEARVAASMARITVNIENSSIHVGERLGSFLDFPKNGVAVADRRRKMESERAFGKKCREARVSCF